MCTAQDGHPLEDEGGSLYLNTELHPRTESQHANTNVPWQAIRFNSWFLHYKQLGELVKPKYILTYCLSLYSISVFGVYVKFLWKIQCKPLPFSHLILHIWFSISTLIVHAQMTLLHSCSSFFFILSLKLVKFKIFFLSDLVYYVLIRHIKTVKHF